MSRTSKFPKREVVPRREGREPAARALSQRWLPWLVPLGIALLTVAAFLPTLHNGFVDWDDGENFLNNRQYRGLGWPQLRWMFTTFHMGQWIPLTWMTLGLDYRLWGMNPLGYHLTSLLVHAANAVVFYLVARRLLTAARAGAIDQRPAAVALSAGLAALLFALHPLRVESVAWATERRDVLSGLFYLLTLLAYLRACERGERGRGWYWTSLALFACALLSKSMAVSLPVVLLILDVYPLRRLGGSTGWWGKDARRVYLEKLPFVLLALAASALAFLALFQIHNMTSLDQLSGLGRLAVSAYGLSFYLWKMVLPVNLSPLYEIRNLNPGATSFLLSSGVVLALTALALACRRRVPGLPATWLTYVVILLPVLGIFQNGPQIAADRYTYLAGLGWALLAGAGLLSWGQAAGRWLAGPALCAVLGLGVLTWQQVHVWRDSETLWTHALAMEPASPIGQSNLGNALADQGKLAEAIAHFQHALQINPGYAEGHNNWGAMLARQGKLAEAIEHYRQALQIKPDYADPHVNWGAALADQGKPAEAIEHYRQALRIKAHHAGAYNNLGAALADQGKSAEAIEHYRQALQIKPDYADPHVNWGAALARQGKPAEAIEHFRQALEIKPDHADAHVNWGETLADQGKLAEAIEHYRQALRIKPDQAHAHTYVGQALARQGKLAEAIEHYQQALEIKPDFADAHVNWGVALARQGKPVEAIAHFQRALQIKPGYAKAQSGLFNALPGLRTDKQDAPPVSQAQRPAGRP